MTDMSLEEFLAVNSSVKSVGYNAWEVIGMSVTALAVAFILGCLIWLVFKQRKKIAKAIQIHRKKEKCPKWADVKKWEESKIKVRIGKHERYF